MSTELKEQLKGLFVEHGIEPHWCGTEDCEASRQTSLFFDALESLVASREKEIELKALEATRHDVDFAKRWRLSHEEVLKVMDDRIADIKARGDTPE